MRTPAFWHDNNRAILWRALIPFSWIFCATARIRRTLYTIGAPPSRAVAAPVIIIGNITAGGGGKTPLVKWTADFLRERGYKPGVVSRGYGGRRQKTPRMAAANSDPAAVGDEAVLLAAAGYPVAVATKRADAADMLMDRADVNVIIADDGLQHYALRRDIEIAVINGEQGFGNGHCMPAGPLREKPARLKEADIVVINGRDPGGLHMGKTHAMKTNIATAINMKTGATKPITDFADKPIHAVAAIAHPRRFFAALEQHGAKPIPHAFPDHYQYRPTDLAFADHPILMTDKDAVKCAPFATAQFWRVPLNVEIEESFRVRLLELLRAATSKKTKPR